MSNFSVKHCEICRNDPWLNSDAIIFITTEKIIQSCFCTVLYSHDLHVGHNFHSQFFCPVDIINMPYDNWVFIHLRRNNYYFYLKLNSCRSWREWRQDVSNVQVYGNETSGNWKVLQHFNLNLYVRTFSLKKIAKLLFSCK